MSILCVTLVQLHFNHHCIQFYVHNFPKLYILHFIQLYCQFIKSTCFSIWVVTLAMLILNQILSKERVEEAESNIIYESN